MSFYILRTKTLSEMKLRICILQAKVLADGSHKIRIAISHKGTTRYFLTRFTVPSESNLCNGVVVGIDKASYINKQLALKMSKIYEAYDSIDDAEYLTCSQLVSEIEGRMLSEKPHLLLDVANEYIKKLEVKGIAKSTRVLYDWGYYEVEHFFGKNFFIKNLTSSKVNDFMASLKKKLSDTTVRMRMKYLKFVVAYAIRHKYVSYDVNPFTDVTIPSSAIRDCAISIEDIRKIRDLPLSVKEHGRIVTLARDYFMSSFFLCGMNMADIISTDLTKDEVSFKRQKTASRRKNSPNTVFTIQPEARMFISRILDENGKVISFKGRTLPSFNGTCRRGLEIISDLTGIDKQRLTFYSARKTFAQLANELMIKDSIIEYCLGDSVSTTGKVIGHYINVNQRMADKAIRKVFDAVASDKSLEELVDEAL